MIRTKKDVTPDDLHEYARWVGTTGRPVVARIMHWSAEIIEDLQREIDRLTDNTSTHRDRHRHENRNQSNSEDLQKR